MLLFAIKSGADSVMIVGWRPDECQFKDGNFKAQTHVDLANRILDRRGFGNQRINQYWLSGAESDKLVKSVEDTLEKVKRLGPNPLKLKDSGSKSKVKKAKKVLTTPAEWFL